MAYNRKITSVGISLEDYERTASKQEQAILAYFLEERIGCPSEVQELTLPDAPLTSVRRAMTNLSNKGYLRKTRTTVYSPHGQPEHMWVLNGGEHNAPPHG